MNASRLHEAVKDVPKSCWPEGLDYSVPEGGGEPLWLLDFPDGYHDVADEEGDGWKRSAEPLDDRMRSIASILPPSAAMLLFEAWMLNAILMRGVVVYVYHSDERGRTCMYVHGIGHRPMSIEKPSKLEALAAVCKAVVT